MSLTDAPLLASPPQDQAVSVGLTAAVVAVAGDEPQVLTVGPTGAPALAGLPSGPLEPEHRTLEAGLRAWVERQTGQTLGYVEQLYTFGDQNREWLPGADPDSTRALSIGYVALTQARQPAGGDARWRSWYRFFPWEDWRQGRPEAHAALEWALTAWAAGAPTPVQARARSDRVRIAFGLGDAGWNDEAVLERYELLYEIGLVPEAARDAGRPPPEDAPALAAEPLRADHRRILATAIARVRGKIKYRPVVFELMPPAFTLLQFQRTVEALTGVRLHKQNFRRLVDQQGLVDETGEIATATGGRPARLVRFRREVLAERAVAGVKVPMPRRLE